MSDSSTLSGFLSTVVETGGMHGAVWGARDGARRMTGAVGLAAPPPDAVPATVETVYDLASLTKPLATGLLYARLFEAGRLDPDAPVAELLPELAPLGNIRVWQLLTHCAGLRAWLPFYALCDSPDEVLHVITRLGMEYETGRRVIYSDLGYIALGIALERATGKRFDRIFHEEVAQPLGLTETSFTPPSERVPRIAATELGNAHERGMVATIPLPESERARVAAYGKWRTHLLRGEVHDGNAHFLGGVSGHAGLFAPLADVFTLAEQCLPGSRLLRDDTLRLFSESRTPGLEEERSIGWMLAKTPNSTAGDALPPSAFGHTGFTGTSLWIDPERGRIYVLLANRTFPIQNFNPTRRMFHTLADRMIETVRAE